jgi:nucleotide-binding universal stress UspA family protein
MKRVLVPLLDARDSQLLAPLVGALAKGHGARVRCIHVRSIPGPREGHWGRVVATSDQEMARLTAQALADPNIAEVHIQGVPMENVVRFGDAPQEIIVEAEAWDADLVVLVGGPDTWIRRLGVRGVARAVLRRASVPVVVYRPPSPSLAVRLGHRLESLLSEGIPDSENMGMVGRW